MKQTIFFSSLVIFLFSSGCRSKSPGEKKSHFPALSFIQSQVAHVDTSLFSIMRIDYGDSSDADTSYIRREEFRAAAKDFLEIPDLTTSALSKRFTEQSNYDETLGRVMLTSYPVDKEKEVLQRQEVLITPSAAGDKVNSIFIDLLFQNRDSVVQKRLLWRVDQSFQVSAIRQKPGQPEIITTTKVIWNEPADQ